MSAKPADIRSWLAMLDTPSADRDYKPGHARMRALLARMPLRRPRLRVRVAGTNGKGSTAWMLAAALRACGLRVGLYTSPHILRFNERIRIDGRPIDDPALLALLERIAPLALACGASYFEAATAMALAHFSAARVDVEILEAGVGARLDATTAVDADAALITPIGLDHQAWLGDTLAEIAREKAHAALGCDIALAAPQAPEAADALREIAPHVHFATPWPENAPLAAPGGFQRVNAGLAMAAARALTRLDARIDAASARAAIAAAAVPGRLQRLRHERAAIWLDAAHNRHAIEALLPALPTLADPLDAILVFPREDRSLEDCLPLLAPFARRIVTRADAPDAPTALRALLRDQPDARLLALGSFTTIAAILRLFAAEGAPPLDSDGRASHAES